MIRVSACDLAGNTTTREFNLATLPVSNAALPAVTKNTANTLLLESSHDKTLTPPPLPEGPGAPVSSNSTVLVTEQTIPYSDASLSPTNSNALVTAGHGPGVVAQDTVRHFERLGQPWRPRSFRLQCDVPGRVARQAAHGQQSACVS